MANQWTANPSFTYGACHVRLRKIRGKASDRMCYFCETAQAAEWAQLHGTDGSSPYGHFRPLCISCHRAYDGTSEAVAASNRRRTGEKRKQYVIRDMKAYRQSQYNNCMKRWG